MKMKAQQKKIPWDTLKSVLRGQFVVEYTHLKKALNSPNKWLNDLTQEFGKTANQAQVEYILRHNKIRI